jgi:hypothetical protein
MPLTLMDIILRFVRQLGKKTVLQLVAGLFFVYAGLRARKEAYPKKRSQERLVADRRAEPAKDNLESFNGPK